ncbi:SGNH/GDSL hydrolase family protein [Candidatus Daviesbacteria bacterium]|nr:SGNH/GDSL hydrolase family protein [Candidatus Daviesbacteria bacterium]
MLFGKKILFVIIPVIFVLLAIAFFRFNLQEKIERRILGLSASRQASSEPKQVSIKGKQKVKYPEDYTILLLGDSMTERLGNSDELRAYLKGYYPNKSFEVLNYGFGSTNILSVQERLEKETFHGRKFRPILDIAFDLILIESFGHNPLSQFSLEEGLRKQTGALDKIVASIRKENPNTKLLFVATIAPNKRSYGEGQVDLTPDVREKWALERNAYIKNHIEYANSHQIPLINIFEKSLNEDGDGDLMYIDSADFIHPSPSGIYFISKEIADYVYNNKILNP